MSAPVDGLLLALEAGIATITLNHPERANALDPAEYRVLAGMLSGLAADSSLRAVVLTGAGERAFCAGLNLRNAEAIQADLSSQGPTGLGAALRAAAILPVPIIGRINGACVAGGMGLLGACDEAVAVDTARFGLPEIRHGIYPHVAMAGIAGRGDPAVLAQMAESGEMIEADAARSAGLVDEVCAPADLDRRVEARLAAIFAGATCGRLERRLAEGSASLEARLDAAEALARATSTITVNS